MNSSLIQTRQAGLTFYWDKENNEVLVRRNNSLDNEYVFTLHQNSLEGFHEGVEEWLSSNHIAPSFIQRRKEWNSTEVNKVHIPLNWSD